MSNKVELIFIEGETNIVAALQTWSENKTNHHSLGPSGAVFDYSLHNNTPTLALSYYEKSLDFSSDNIRAYSRAKLELAGGLGFHFSQILFGLRIWFIALKHRPNTLCVHQCVTHLFMLSPLKYLGIKVIPMIHSLFWEDGEHQPQGKLKQLIVAADAWFLKRAAHVALCASTEIEQQVHDICKQQHCDTYVFDDDNINALMAQVI